MGKKREEGFKLIVDELALDAYNRMIVRERYCAKEDGHLVMDVMKRDDEFHGVCFSNFSEGQEREAPTLVVRYQGRNLTPLTSATTEEEVFIHQLEDFFLMDALSNTLDYSSPFLADDRILLPLLRQADDLAEAINEVAEHGLDEPRLKEYRFIPNQEAVSRDLYQNYFPFFEMREYDLSAVAERYMKDYAYKSFPEVLVSEALKQEMEHLSNGRYAEKLQNSLDLYVPLLSTEVLGMGMNTLETLRIEIADSIEKEYSKRQVLQKSKHLDVAQLPTFQEKPEEMDPTQKRSRGRRM